MRNTAKVRVRGVRELSRAFGKVDRDLPKELRDEFKGIATTAAGRVASKVPRDSGTAAGSVKPRASTRGAGIAVGGARAPYFAWLDFGGSVGRHGSIKRDWMGKPGGDGRYLYPTLHEMQPETAEAADEAIKKVARSAGFDTRGKL